MKNKLESIVRNGYGVNFNEVFKQSWDLYTKVLGVGVLAVVMYAGSSFLLGFLVESLTGMKAISNELSQSMEGVQDPNTMMSLVRSFYLDNWQILTFSRLIVDLVMILAFPLAGGFMLVCREADKSGTINISLLFEGFKPQYWSRLIVLGISYFILSKIALILFVLPGIYVWVAGVIACPIVMFSNLNGIEALKMSFRIINKNWANVFVILFVASLIGFLGYLLCGIGRIATYPFVLVTVYMLYKHIVGFTDDEISEIGQ